VLAAMPVALNVKHVAKWEMSCHLQHQRIVWSGQLTKEGMREFILVEQIIKRKASFLSHCFLCMSKFDAKIQ